MSKPALYKDCVYESDLETTELDTKAISELMRYWMAPWCKCICRIAPDGTMCKVCGHAHVDWKAE